MKVIDKSVYNFSKNNPAIETASVGELLLFKTMDCFSDKITSEELKMSDIDWSYNVTNPAAGPVCIEGAEVGDVLVVDILEVNVAEVGTVCTSNTCGPLCEDCEERTRKVHITDGVAEFNGVKFPIDPMIGVIGTAPDGEDVIDGYPGNHGGNMDSKLITKGSRLYLPVRVAGAMLQMGDVHATMGDGELCGTGIEIPAEILVKTSLIKNFELNWPVTETADGWYVHGCAQEYNEALKNASIEMQRLIMNITGWDKTDTYMYMSIQCDVQINQGCKPCEVPMIVRMGMKKLPQFDALIK